MPAVSGKMTTAGGAMPADGSDLAARRLRMVEEQIVRRGVRDDEVLAALRCVPRHLFVGEGSAGEAYADTPLPIGHGQTISQPYMVALMTSLLGVDVRSRVLEVGAGSGYQTAVLAEMAGEVFAVERLAPLAERARATLTRLGYTNVQLAIGDGAEGWREQAPFQGILVAAAADSIPPQLLGQLADGGRLVIPIGRGEQVLTVVERVGDEFEERHDTRCRFVPLIRDADADRTSIGAADVGGGADTGEGCSVKSVEVRVSGVVQGVYYRASQRWGCAAGCATRPTAPCACGCRESPPAWMRCWTGVASARRRRRWRGSRSRTFRPMTVYAASR